MSKYDPLRRHLESLESSEWRVRFSDVEKVLGFPLPRSAYVYQAWWANETRTATSQQRAWLDAGWETSNLNLMGKTVEFVRTGKLNPQTRPDIALRPSTPGTRKTERPPVWLDNVLAELAERRPIFHSEADFQHALAWLIHELKPDVPIRLEYKPFPTERIYIDLWLGGEKPIAIELKYGTRLTDVHVGDERYLLANQSAHDITRYDFLKDIIRLERVAGWIPGSKGYAVMLTNDRAYWSPGRRDNTVDSAFRIHDGRQISGELGWASHAGEGTTKGRTNPLSVSGSYELCWRSYSTVEDGASGEFRYLLVPVGETDCS